MDPHEYELRPGDVRMLQGADIIVSTAHAPFERIIREKVESGELRAELLEIPRIGVRILRNPVTGQPNYHMPIYDPDNYLIFMDRLRDEMSRLNPGCAGDYEERFRRLSDRIREIEARAPRMNVTAVAVNPVAQYAVEWTGVRIRYLLLKDRGVPATPPELARVTRDALLGRIGLMVLVGDPRTPLNRKAAEMAAELGIPSVRVPSPLEPRSFPDKLEDVIGALSRVGGVKPAHRGYGQLPLIVTILILAASLSAALYLVRQGN